jgi:hypothetical protein
MCTAGIIVNEQPHTGIEGLQYFIQTTFVKRGITITYFHTIYHKMNGYRIAHINL